MNLSKHLLIICLLFFDNVILSKDKSLKKIEFSKEEINYLNKAKEDVVYIDQATKQIVNKLYKKEMIKNPGNSLLQFCQACQDNWKIVPMRVAQEASKELEILIEKNKDKFTEERYKKVNSTVKNYQVNLQSKDAQFFFASNEASAVNATRTFNNLVVNDTLQVNNLFRVNHNGTLGVRVGNDPTFASGRVVSHLPVRINFTPTEGTPNSFVVIGTTVLDNLLVRTNQTVRGSLNAGENITIKDAPVILNADNVGDGVGVFRDKSGNILNFKSLVAGNNVTLDNSNPNQITISAIGTGLGDVSGPASATNNAVARYDGNTGKLIQNSGVIIDDSDNLSTAGQITAIQFNGPLNGNATSATTATTATTAVTATTATNFTGSLSGDVTGTQSATVVSLVGGKTAAQVSATVDNVDAATSSNVGNTLVLRDISGNFSSNQITATQFNGPLNGNATTATTATTAVTATTATNFTGSLSGDVTGTQSATVVSLVGGKTAAQVSATVDNVDAATSSNVGNTLVLRDISGNFSSNQITATQFNGPLNGNATTATTATTAVTATTATNFTGSLSGDVTGTQNATVVSLVGGKTAAQVASTVNTVDAATDAPTASTLVLRDVTGSFSANQITATQFNGPLNGNATSATTAVTATTATNFTGSLSGDVTGTQNATVVSLVGGKTATEVSDAVDDVQNATPVTTGSTLVLRDGTGSFSANQITATQFNGPLNGNATSATTAVTATTATNFTGSLSGDVTGTQNATVVSLVGGKTAAQVASTVNTVDAATDAPTASTLVLRDVTGSFSANQITATQFNGPLNGNATSATTAVTATDFTGSLSGDVTGTQNATVVSLVGGKTAAQVSATVDTVDAATPVTTASTLVLRDGTGSFSANQITATQFNGPLNGNATSATTATTATTATNFTGSLSGDVTGTQSATVVSTVGGKTAAQVASTVNTVSFATSSDVASTLVLRDNFGSFSANDINVDGNLNLTTSPSTGIAGEIRLGGNRFVHNLSNVTNFFGGVNSGNPSTSGVQNTGIGNISLSGITTGNANTAVGYASLQSTNTGLNNTAIGSSCMTINNAGSQNTALGAQCAIGVQGDNNVAIGYQALMTGLAQNTAVGVQALAGTTGTQNTALGFQAGANLNGSEIQNVYISNLGVPGESNTIRIGTAPEQLACYIAGISGITTGGVAVPVLIDSNGQLGTISSSVRYKQDIKNMDNQSDRIAKLNPVTFKYKTDKTGKSQYGLIAEEVEKVLPELVVYKDGKPETIQYQFLPILLLKDHQRMQKKMQELEAKIQELSNQKKS